MHEVSGTRRYFNHKNIVAFIAILVNEIPKSSSELRKDVTYASAGGAKRVALTYY